MKYLLNTEKNICTFAIAFAMFVTPTIASDGNGGDSVEGKLREVDIQACFALEYDSEDITPQAAYDIAKCFSKLANSMVDSHSDEFVADTELWMWDDKNVLLHYADSWFSYAAYKGHPDAAEQLETTRRAFK